MKFHRGVERGAAVSLGDGDFGIAQNGESVRRDLLAVDFQRDLILTRHYERPVQPSAAEPSASAPASGSLLLNARLWKRLHAQIPERGVDTCVSLAFQRVARMFADQLAR